MKKLLSIVGVVLAATVIHAQTVTPVSPGVSTTTLEFVAPTSAATNTAPKPTLIQSLNPAHWAGFAKSAITASNITGVVYGTRFERNKAFGGGFMALYNFNNYISAGLGSDYAGEWREFSGTVAAHYQFQLTPRLSATLYGVGAAGSSVGGAGNDNGSFATGEGGGAHFNFKINDRWSAGAGLGYITRQNCGAFSGGSEIGTLSVGWSF